MDSWLWTPGCRFLVVASWLFRPGCGLLVVECWLWIPGCGLLAVDSFIAVAVDPWLWARVDLLRLFAKLYGDFLVLLVLKDDQEAI